MLPRSMPCILPQAYCANMCPRFPALLRLVVFGLGLCCLSVVFVVSGAIFSLFWNSCILSSCSAQLFGCCNSLMLLYKAVILLEYACICAKLVDTWVFSINELF